MTPHFGGGFAALRTSFRSDALPHGIFSLAKGSRQHLSINLIAYSSRRTSRGAISTEFLQPASLVKEARLPVLWVFDSLVDLTSSYILKQRPSFQCYRGDTVYWLYVAAYGKTSVSSGQLLFAVLKL